MPIIRAVMPKSLPLNLSGFLAILPKLTPPKIMASKHISKPKYGINQPTSPRINPEMYSLRIVLNVCKKVAF